MAVRGRGASGWTVSEDDDRTKGGGCIAGTDPSVRLNCERCSSRREAGAQGMAAPFGRAVQSARYEYSSYS